MLTFLFGETRLSFVDITSASHQCSYDLLVDTSPSTACPWDASNPPFLIYLLHIPHLPYLFSMRISSHEACLSAYHDGSITTNGKLNFRDQFVELSRRKPPFIFSSLFRMQTFNGM